MGKSVLKKLFVFVLLAASLAAAHHIAYYGSNSYYAPYGSYGSDTARYYTPSAYTDPSQYASVTTYNAPSNVLPNDELTPTYSRFYRAPAYYVPTYAPTPQPVVFVYSAPTPLPQLPVGKSFPLYKGMYNRWYYSPYEGYGATQPASPDAVVSSGPQFMGGYNYWYAPSDAGAQLPNVYPTSVPLVSNQVKELFLQITHFGGFSPSVISANRGEVVRILATTDFPTHQHGFVIGVPFNINRRITSTSTTAPDVIEFVASTPGTFQISCGCGSNHFAAGGSDFTGTLVVN